MVFTLICSGCRSPFISVKIENHSGSALQLLEMDYPSASFGVDSLAAGAAYSYRFKVQGAGPVSLTFTDATGHVHKVSGPSLDSGQQGTLTVLIGPADKTTWQTHLSMQ
ncbi:hypothetical protein C7378_3366 [Acidipila rosea]|uniref:Uncharacterized protein n=1 Tax=Acidipila rosea TaxID=768535 RepID=A0A4V2PUD9_9BACT|nr:hypothetical protein C7378_3366 [Acidipila rosea]